MNKIFLLKVFTVVLMGALLGLQPANAASRYSKATKTGPARALNCGKGAFFDIKGECWECPKGYKHDNILLAPTNKKVCKKQGATKKIKADKVGKSVAGICKKGSWVSLNNGNCYKCPKGYKHNPALFGDKTGVCYKKSADNFSAAKKKSGTLVCRDGFFDPIDKGSCWTCPAAFPRRTLKSVKSNEACEVQACGVLNGRPCLITERIPSCDKGLAEDFIQNKCVKSLTAVQICKGVLKAFKAGTNIVGFDKLADRAKSLTGKTRSEFKGSKAKRDELLAKTIKAVGPHKDLIPELERLGKVAAAAHSKVKALFEPNTFCDGSVDKMSRKLESLGLRPNFKIKKSGLLDNGLLIGAANAAANDHFFMSYSLTLGASAGLGVSGALTIVTDYRGKGGGYISVGPQIQGNVAAGANLGIQFFPATKLAAFTGWGWGYGASGGPPSKVFGVGIDTTWGESFILDFQGFGVNASVGAGVLPADLAMSATHAWKLW